MAPIEIPTEILTFIHEESALGRSTRWIAECLTAAKIPTARGRSTTWNLQSVRSYLLTTRPDGQGGWERIPTSERTTGIPRLAKKKAQSQAAPAATNKAAGVIVSPKKNGSPRNTSGWRKHF